MSVLRSTGVCLLLLVFIGACVSVPAPASADVGISFDFFYSNLSPHGHWLVSGSYGRVWQPSVYTAGWNPYYDGHWLYTDVGWTWVSDYHWGAVPYHYGTWVLDGRYGWVWVPGYVWAPSWVVFRTGPDYIGWAPVPVGYSVGMSIGFSDYSHDHFVFVASRDFVAPRIRSYAVPASSTRVIINNTRIENTIKIENNVVINTGPDVNVVRRASGRRIEAESIERVPRVGPARRMSRSELRADAAGRGTRLRAAEPISEQESEVVIRRGRSESRDPRAGESNRGPSEPEGRRPNRSPRFSPSADPQAQPDADTRQDSVEREPARDSERSETQPDRDSRRRTMDREQARDRGAQREEIRPDRGRRLDPTAERGRMSSDDSRSRTDAGERAETKSRADAKAKADAKKKADAKAKERAKKKEKEKPKPPPSDEKPPR